MSTHKVVRPADDIAARLPHERDIVNEAGHQEEGILNDHENQGVVSDGKRSLATMMTIEGRIGGSIEVIESMNRQSRDRLQETVAGGMM